jgi:hypothetical protein
MLSELAAKHGASKAEHRHYCDIYERHFAPLREKATAVLEIGVQGGGSLRMWKDYFPNAKITGIDVKEKCLEHAAERIEVRVGDQADVKFLTTLASTEWDIIIDDGGHTMQQQSTSLTFLWPTVKLGGIYVVEDLHTSYWPEFGGSKPGEESMLNELKGLADAVNAKHWHKNERAKPHKTKGHEAPFCLWVDSVHFYDSLCFIYKREKERKL